MSFEKFKGLGYVQHQTIDGAAYSMLYENGVCVSAWGIGRGEVSLADPPAGLKILSAEEIQQILDDHPANTSALVAVIYWDGKETVIRARGDGTFQVGWMENDAPYVRGTRFVAIGGGYPTADEAYACLQYSQTAINNHRQVREFMLNSDGLGTKQWDEPFVQMAHDFWGAVGDLVNYVSRNGLSGEYIAEILRHQVDYALKFKTGPNPRIEAYLESSRSKKTISSEEFLSAVFSGSGQVVIPEIGARTE
jgi:hypothetical protein